MMNEEAKGTVSSHNNSKQEERNLSKRAQLTAPARSGDGRLATIGLAAAIAYCTVRREATASFKSRVSLKDP